MREARGVFKIVADYAVILIAVNWLALGLKPSPSGEGGLISEIDKLWYFREMISKEALGEV